MDEETDEHRLAYEATQAAVFHVNIITITVVIVVAAVIFIVVVVVVVVAVSVVVVVSVFLRFICGIN